MTEIYIRLRISEKVHEGHTVYLPFNNTDGHHELPGSYIAKLWVICESSFHDSGM